MVGKRWSFVTLRNCAHELLKARHETDVLLTDMNQFAFNLILIITFLNGLKRRLCGIFQALGILFHCRNRFSKSEQSLISLLLSNGEVIVRCYVPSVLWIMLLWSPPVCWIVVLSSFSALITNSLIRIQWLLSRIGVCVCRWCVCVGGCAMKNFNSDLPSHENTSSLRLKHLYHCYLSYIIESRCNVSMCMEIIAIIILPVIHQCVRVCYL